MYCDMNRQKKSRDEIYDASDINICYLKKIPSD